MPAYVSLRADVSEHSLHHGLLKTVPCVSCLVPPELQTRAGISDAGITWCGLQLFPVAWSRECHRHDSVDPGLSSLISVVSLQHIMLYIKTLIMTEMRYIDCRAQLNQIKPIITIK